MRQYAITKKSIGIGENQGKENIKGQKDEHRVTQVVKVMWRTSTPSEQDKRW